MEDISRLLTYIRNTFPLANDCEITMEGRISNMTRDKVEAYLQGGVNRFSLGVQSFNTDLRRSMGRRSDRDTIIGRINMIKEYKLEKQILFVGKKQNPYPYFKISDCVILTSDYEGYPVVFLESMILNKPIITTKVSDYEDIEGKFGYTTSKDIDDIYQKMKLFIENGFEIKEKFDAEQYNNIIMEKLEKIF